MVPENYMTTSGAESGLYLLEIHAAARDGQYLEAAVRIAETYGRRQQPDGSWPLFVRGRDGSPVTKNVMVPTLVVEFLDRLGETSASDRFAAMRDGAVAALPAVAREEPVALSPFVIAASADTGYLSSSTLAGSRLRTDFKDIAAQVSVMMPEFLADIGAFSNNDAFSYSLNTETAAEIGGVAAQFFGAGWRAGVSTRIREKAVVSPASRPSSRLRIRVKSRSRSRSTFRMLLDRNQSCHPRCSSPDA